MLPSPEWFETAFFEQALGNSWRIVVASLVAFCIGDLIDDRIFRNMKRKHETMKGFAVRALTSSFFGHVVDTILFIMIAFAFIVPWNEIPGMIALGIVLKFAYECAIIPLTYKVTKAVKAFESRNNGDEQGNRS
jgi:hypothetical protein